MVMITNHHGRVWTHTHTHTYNLRMCKRQKITRDENGYDICMHNNMNERRT